MENLGSEKTLDVFLKYFSELPDLNGKNIAQIHIDYPIYPLKEIIEIIGKLKKDGYVWEDYKTENAISRNIVTPSFTSTFDGRMFITNGGYEAKALRDANDALLTQKELDRRKELDGLLIERSTRLNVLTNRLFWATVVASVAALLLLSWQVFLWINPTYSNFPYVFLGIVRKTIR